MVYGFKRGKWRGDSKDTIDDSKARTRRLAGFALFRSMTLIGLACMAYGNKPAGRSCCGDQLPVKHGMHTLKAFANNKRNCTLGEKPEDKL